MFFVPLFVVLSAVLGGTFGFFASFALALTLPVDSVVPGPEGTPITVLNDHSAVPIFGGALGIFLGVGVGLLAAAQRWRRTRSR